jgi:translation initiation factor IF-2
MPARGSDVASLTAVKGARLTSVADKPVRGGAGSHPTARGGAGVRPRPPPTTPGAAPGGRGRGVGSEVEPRRNGSRRGSDAARDRTPNPRGDRGSVPTAGGPRRGPRPAQSRSRAGTADTRPAGVFEVPRAVTPGRGGWGMAGPDHRQDAGADRLGQARPGGHYGGQGRARGGGLVGLGGAEESARSAGPRHPRGGASGQRSETPKPSGEGVSDLTSAGARRGRCLPSPRWGLRAGQSWSPSRGRRPPDRREV